MERPKNSVRNRTLSLFWARGIAGAWRVLLNLFGTRGSAGAWSILRILLGIDAHLAVLVAWQCWRLERLFGIDDILAVLGVWQRWHVERPENSVWNRRPSRCCRWEGALAHGVSCDFRLELTPISSISSGGSFGARSVLRILSGIDDLRAVSGACQDGRVPAS